MQGAQNRKKTPGAFRSCLIPHKEEIFKWWFNERTTATEIKRRLLEKYNIDVHYTTITRFIKVRRNRPDPHELPEIEQENSQTADDSKTKKSSEEIAEGERLFEHLKNSIVQKLGLEAEKAKKNKK